VPVQDNEEHRIGIEVEIDVDALNGSKVAVEKGKLIISEIDLPAQILWSETDLLQTGQVVPHGTREPEDLAAVDVRDVVAGTQVVKGYQQRIKEYQPSQASG
jgi:hypothetical protein